MRVNRPVAIIVDENTDSSAEIVMLSFRGLDYSQSFGQPTAGYATTNVSLSLYDGDVMLLSVGREKGQNLGSF